MSGRKRLCDQMHGSARVEAKGATLTLCELSEEGKAALDVCLGVEQERSQNSDVDGVPVGQLRSRGHNVVSISCAYSLHTRESE
jgi:hypothetical protein